MCEPAAWNLMHLAQHWARSLSFIENPTPQRPLIFPLDFQGIQGSSDQPLITSYNHSYPFITIHSIILHPCFYRAPVQSSAIVALRRWRTGIPRRLATMGKPKKDALTTLWPILAKECQGVNHHPFIFKTWQKPNSHQFTMIHCAHLCKHPIYANPIIPSKNAAGSLGICTFHWATLLLEAGKKKKKNYRA